MNYFVIELYFFLTGYQHELNYPDPCKNVFYGF